MVVPPLDSEFAFNSQIWGQRNCVKLAESIDLSDVFAEATFIAGQTVDDVD